MSAARYDWTIPQGSYATFDFKLRDSEGDPIATTGLSGRGQIRTTPGSTALVGTLTVTAVDHADGHWRVECLPAALSGYAFGERDRTKGHSDLVVCWYDVELYDPEDATNVRRRVEGKALISVEVTK